jgi:hypothetical protein
MSAQSFDASIVGGSARSLVARPWATHLLWVAAAAVLGFGVAQIFAGLLHLPRSIYLIPYVALVSLFVYAFGRWSNVSVLELLRHNWIWGAVGAVLIGAFTVSNILSQPASARSEGLTLVLELLWVGVVYGLIDALLLSVLPVLATWQAFTALGWTTHWWGRIVTSVLAIVLSLVVTEAYHLGYPECRVAGGLVGPTIGNAAMTIGYVLSGNPVAAMFSHMAMHIAGVLQGPASVLQLPPHY